MQNVKMPVTQSVRFLIFAVLFSGCSYGIKRTGYVERPVPPGACEPVITKTWTFDKASRKLGSISLYDEGMSVGCGKQKGMEILKREACALRADVIYIVDEAEPDFYSSCYRVNAVFLAVQDSSATIKPDVVFAEGKVVDTKPQKTTPMALQIVLYVVGYVAGYALVSAIL